MVRLFWFAQLGDFQIHVNGTSREVQVVQNSQLKFPNGKLYVIYIFQPVAGPVRMVKLVPDSL